jgi:hypothetical protein
MRQLSLIVATVAIGLMSGGANAAVTIDTSTPTSFTMVYDGFDTSAQTPIAGLTGEIAFSFVNTTNSGKTVNFTYSITNTSSAPITASRISGFGFDTTPDIVSGTVDGVFDTVKTSGNVPNVGTIDVCFSDVNCAGGAFGGVTIGDTAGGNFTLTFASAPTTLTLDDFYVRYQSIEGVRGLSSASGLGDPQPAVPEPATWAMMIGGMGMVGASMRRRSQKLQTVTA